ncbi:ACP S-malonyltransferase [Kineococcus gypseus]|uniref:ACP S-malonyltransferase n=1 Tax=Kineococcus gypseus TaxID=1637102 RepID=UPI003D7CA38A
MIEVPEQPTALPSTTTATALLAPGQGAQRPGQLAPWLELPGVEQLLGELSEAAELDLVAAGTTWTAEQILPTEVAQPLLVATSLVVGRELLRHGAPAVLAGHSVGEWTAAALAGVLDDATALRLVAARGRAMAACCRGAAAGMSVVLGGEPGAVHEAVLRAGLVPANHNGAGQLVVGGAAHALAALEEQPPQGAVVRRLQVAGAFHTPAMAAAVPVLAGAAAAVHPRDPRLPLLSNADGERVPSGAEVLRRLVEQVARPVRWDLCTETLRRSGTTTVLELPPAGALSGLARRALPDVRVVPVRTPEDLRTAGGLLAAG